MVGPPKVHVDVASTKSIKNAFTVFADVGTRHGLFGTASNPLLKQAKHLNNSHMRHAGCRLLADTDPHYIRKVGELFECRRK
jgi:hypothetical protein